MEAVVLGIYCIIAWKCGWTKAPRDDNFFVMIATTYEVEEEEDPTLERLLYEDANNVKAEAEDPEQK